MKTSSALRLENLSVSFGDVSAVRDLSFELAPGATLGIVGESGSGKSISLRAMMGILPSGASINSGRLWAGSDEVPLGGKRVRRGRLAMVFQDPSAALNPVMRVGDLIAEVPRRVLGRSAAESRRIALDLMRQVHLPDPEKLARAYPHQLSGGQRQRIMIAAALATEPEVLLCDEPTTALDVTVQAAVLDLLAEIRAKTSLATVFVSHDLAVVSQVADEIIVMRQGEVVETGSALGVLREPRNEYTQMLLDSVISLPSEPPPAAAVAVEFGTPRLSAHGIEVRYPRSSRPALAGVSLDLHPGRIHGLVGESGSGKTTLARVLTGQQQPDSGTVSLGSNVLRRRRSREQLRAVQMVFQDPYASLDPRMTVRQTLTELLKLNGLRGKTALEDRCRELLDQVALPDWALDRVPGQFSGGQRQRIAIARALAVNPQVLVADEPTSALDVSVQASVLDLMARLRDEFGLSILLISHNLAVVHEICDEVSVIHHGEIVETGATRDVFAHPANAYTQQLIESVPRLRTEAS